MYFIVPSKHARSARTERYRAVLAEAEMNKGWNSKMLQEILSGLYRLSIPLSENPLGAVNTYVVVGEDGLKLIDCGWVVAHLSRMARSSL